MKSLILIIGVLFVAAGLFFSSGTAEAHGHGFHGMFWVMDQLTEEQRAEVHETIDRMMEEGATRCEIHEAVRGMLEGYGIELPDRPGFMNGLGRGFGPGHMLDQLTDEQRAEVHETIDRMMGEGASPCEIHETVREMLEGYGVKPPCRFEGRHHGWDS